MTDDDPNLDDIDSKHADEDLDALLTAASRALESAPEGLAARIEAQAMLRARRALLGYWTMAAAALLAGVAVFMRGQTAPTERHELKLASTEPTRSPAVPALARAQVAVGEDSIALPLESQSSAVTIVWVYPCASASATEAKSMPTETEKGTEP